MAPLTPTTMATTTTFAFLMLLAWHVSQADASIGSDVQAVIDKINVDTACQKKFEGDFTWSGSKRCQDFNATTDLLNLKASCTGLGPAKTEAYYNEIKNIICGSWSDEAYKYVKMASDCRTALAEYRIKNCYFQETCCAEFKLQKSKVEAVCKNREYAELEDIVCNGSTALLISSLTILSAFAIGIVFNN